MNRIQRSLLVMFAGPVPGNCSIPEQDRTFMSLFGRPAFRNLGRGVF